MESRVSELSENCLQILGVQARPVRLNIKVKQFGVRSVETRPKRRTIAQADQLRHLVQIGLWKSIYSTIREIAHTRIDSEEALNARVVKELDNPGAMGILKKCQ